MTTYLRLWRFPGWVASGALWMTVGLNSVARASEAKAAYDVREHYTKYEYRIPMRDGAKLFTAVYQPKDDSQRYPFLLTRTPYGVGPYGVDEFPGSRAQAEMFFKAGYIVVLQDVRGRTMSDGRFVDMTPHRAVKSGPADVDESTDTYDTVEWLLHHVPNNNGRVGLWGISYGGFFTSAGIIDSHPAIKAASPQAPVTDLYLNDDSYHGGAFMLAANFGFFTFFKGQAEPRLPPKVTVPFEFGGRDGYAFYLKMGAIANGSAMLGGDNSYWNQSVEHTTYDAYWQARAIWRHLRNVHCAVLTVGGWFDAEDLAGPLRTYRSIEENNPGIENRLVMGPWVHGGWSSYAGRRLGRVDFATDTAVFFREHILLPFFEQHLKDAAAAKLPEAYMFETGTNVWRRYPTWPPRDAQASTLYFHANGGLAFAPPTATEAASDTYVSDPARPVPFVGYTTLDVPQEYMVSDQRFAARRPDVLVYTSDVLEDDVTVAGPVAPKLFVATTGTDADWVVKLIDVYPAERSAPKENAKTPPNDVGVPAEPLGGYQQLVRGDPFRGKFRKSFERPEPFTPGKVEAVNFTMADVNHTFRRGHRIMVQVQSSWFPLVDRNPQTFTDIPHAKPEDFRAATQTVMHTPAQPSGVEVYVLPAPTAAADAEPAPAVKR